jgi:carbon monoxide dehydrogenase subunit G
MGNATNSIWNEIWALKRLVGKFTGTDSQVKRLLPPRNLTVRGGFKALHISWENDKNTALPHTEIFVSETENMEDGRSVARVMSNAFSVFDLDVLRPYWVWVRGVDTTMARYSDWAGPVSAITLGLEEEDFLVGEIAESALAPALAEKIDYINLLDLKLEENMVDLTDRYQEVIDEFNTLSTSIVDYLGNTHELYNTIRDAGIVTDPDTGAVQIYGLEAYKAENDVRVSNVELNIDAVESTLSSKVTLAQVDERIAGAVFGDAGELLLSGVDARIAVVEETLNGVEAELLEKATYVEVDELGGRIGTAESRLDGHDSEIALLATSQELDALESRVSIAEVNIDALEGSIVNKVVSTVTVTQDEEERIAQGLVDAMLNDLENKESSDARSRASLAIAQTELYAYIDDGLTAEAGERTLLAAQVAGNTGAIQSESVVRANADYALSSQITTLQSEVGANASAIQEEIEARADADSAEAGLREQLAARVGTAEANILENANAIADVDGNVRSQWTLQTQAIGAKRAVAGIGLLADGQSGTSEFTVLADNFFVYNPATGAPKKVFQIVNNQALMNGDILATGTVQGEKLAATSTIQLASGGKLIIGSGGIIQIGNSIIIDGNSGNFF